MSKGFDNDFANYYITILLKVQNWRKYNWDKKKNSKFWIGKALFKGEKIKICVEKVKFKVGKSS